MKKVKTSNEKKEDPKKLSPVVADTLSDLSDESSNSSDSEESSSGSCSNSESD